MLANLGTRYWAWRVQRDETEEKALYMNTRLEGKGYSQRSQGLQGRGWRVEGGGQREEGRGRSMERIGRLNGQVA